MDQVGNPNIAKAGEKTRFTSTRQPKKKGRPPANLRKYIKGVNVSREDMRDLFAMIAVKFRTVEELKNAVADPNSHPIIRIYGRAILNDLDKKRVDTLERIIDRGFGKPTDFSETKNKTSHSFETQAALMTPEERAAILEEYRNEILKNKEANNDGDDKG